MARSFDRKPNQLRPVSFEIGIAPHAHGSVKVCFGNTQVICAVTIEDGVPRWMKEQGVHGGWLTAEYSMLPYSTTSRKPRDSSRGRVDGRSMEIQRLIGRSLRAAVDLKTIGSRTIWVDCDVLQADGGTRTASITGACVALGLAGRKLIQAGKISQSPLKQLVTAVSVGVVDQSVLLDLDYMEDKDAEVDLNLVMTEKLEYVELQASGEEAVFSPEQLTQMLSVGQQGIEELLKKQQEILNQTSL